MIYGTSYVIESNACSQQRVISKQYSTIIGEVPVTDALPNKSQEASTQENAICCRPGSGKTVEGHAGKWSLSTFLLTVVQSRRNGPEEGRVPPLLRGLQGTECRH